MIKRWDCFKIYYLLATCIYLQAFLLVFLIRSNQIGLCNAVKNWDHLILEFFAIYDFKM